MSDIGPTSDLSHSPLPSGEAWSTINQVQVVNEDGNVIDTLCMTDWTTYPYFSNYAMSYMKQHYKDLRIGGEFVDIPMKDFDFHKPMFKFTAVNDDMVTYVTNVDQFLCAKICDYRSVPKCLTDFSNLVYSKADMISSLTMLMARGAIISIFAVPCFLPPLLILADPIIIRTTLGMRRLACANAKCDSGKLTCVEAKKDSKRSTRVGVNNRKDKKGVKK